MNKKPLRKNEIIKILKKIKINFLKTEVLNLNKVLNRILAKNIFSKIDLPPFKNSAVDGFALMDVDAKKETELLISNRIVAGNNQLLKLKKGTVARIFTGARMPMNSKTVIMQENVLIKKNSIKFKKKPKVGENCRFAGEDISKNEIILKNGDKITPLNFSLLAAVGKRRIKVYKKIKIGYFTSGNELRKPSELLKGSQINNSNQYSLLALLNKSNVFAKYLGVLKDSKKIVDRLILKSLKNHDVIITTGGASVGEEDHLIECIRSYGKILFWKTAIKPGRPLAVGKIKNTIIICLPGNPVSVYLLYGMIVRPFLEFLNGSKFKLPNSYIGIANFEMSKKTQRLEWLRVTIDKKKKDGIWLKKFPKQGSGMISSISFSDGIIEIPESVNKIKIGDKFKYYPFVELFN